MYQGKYSCRVDIHFTIAGMSADLMDFDAAKSYIEDGDLENKIKRTIEKEVGNAGITLVSTLSAQLTKEE